MLSTSSWLLITSFFSLWQIPVSHRASSSSMSPGGSRDTNTQVTVSMCQCYCLCVCSCDPHTWMSLAVGVWICTCAKKIGGRVLGCVVDAKNSSGLTYVQQMSSCIILTERTPWGSSSLRIAHSRLSLPCCGKKIKLPAGTWLESAGRKRVSCDRRFRLKMCPPQFHISGGPAEGGGHIQRDLFDLHRWSVFC